MKYLISALICIGLASCSKSDKDPRPITCFGFEEPAWLTGKRAEYESCVCLTRIYQGIYENSKIIEIRGVDPRCQGINIVYRLDGVQLFNSGDQVKYQDYLTNVTNAEVIWSCDDLTSQ